MDEETVLKYHREHDELNKFMDFIEFMGYVKKDRVLEIFDSYNFESKRKIMREIRRL